jgi:hypothetical protein
MLGGEVERRHTSPYKGRGVRSRCWYGAGHRFDTLDSQGERFVALRGGVSLSTHLWLHLAAGRACRPATSAAVLVLYIGQGPSSFPARLDSCAQGEHDSTAGYCHWRSPC